MSMLLSENHVRQAVICECQPTGVGSCDGCGTVHPVGGGFITLAGGNVVLCPDCWHQADDEDIANVAEAYSISFTIADEDGGAA